MDEDVRLSVQQAHEKWVAKVVVLMTQSKQFSIRVGVVDVSYETWKSSWEVVATAASEKRVEEVDRIVNESEAFRLKVPLMVAIQAKGIRVPVVQGHLS